MAILKDSKTGNLIEVDTTIPFEYFNQINTATVPPTLHFQMPEKFRYRDGQTDDEAIKQLLAITPRDWDMLARAFKVHCNSRQVQTGKEGANAK